MNGEHHHDHHGHHRQREWGDLLSLEIWCMTVANLRGSGLPRHKTLSVAVSNYWRKVRGWQVCCGNTGHPGC